MYITSVYSVHAPVTFIMAMGAGERVLDDIALAAAAIHEAQIVVAAVVVCFDGQFIPNYVSETRAVVASSTTLTVSARAREFWLIDLVVYYYTSPYCLHHDDGDDDYRALIPSFFFFLLVLARDDRCVRSRTALFGRSYKPILFEIGACQYF